MRSPRGSLLAALGVSLALLGVALISPAQLFGHCAATVSRAVGHGVAPFYRDQGRFGRCAATVSRAAGHGVAPFHHDQGDNGEVMHLHHSGGGLVRTTGAVSKGFDCLKVKVPNGTLAPFCCLD